MNDVSTARRRPPVLWVGLLCVLLVLIFAPMLAAVLHYETDYPSHIEFAITLETTGHFDRPIPQFLYHILLIAVSPLMSGGEMLVQFQSAATLIGLAYYLCTGLLIFYDLASPFDALSWRLRWLILTVLTLALMVAGPINLLTVQQHNLYFGYLTPNTYHNPTVLLLKPFALLAFAFSLQAFRGGQANSKKMFLCATLALLGVFAKPSYALELIPALLLVAAYAYYKKWSVDWPLLGAVILPMLLALTLQYLLYEGRSSSGFDFAPLKVMNYLSPDGSLFPKFILSIAFPAAVYLLYFSQARQQFDLNLAWLVFIISAAFAYLLSEGSDWSAGNFTWGSQVALFILLIVSLLFLFRQLSLIGRPSWKWWVCMLILVLHVVGGIALYLSQFTPQWGDWL